MREIIKGAINALPFDMRYELFYQMGRSLGVKAYQVDGSSGPIFGHLYDQTLIKSYLRDREWSTNIIELIRGAFKGASGAGTFYDIGANVGTVILPVAATCAVKCVGFEPDAGNFALLSANMQAQALSNIDLMKVAVADRRGQLRFARDAYNSGDHRLSATGDIVVDVVALDELPMPALPFVAKIDTQGAEPSIFNGGRRTLAAANLIIAEFWPWAMKRMGLEPSPILEFVQENFERGYVLRHGEKLGEFEPIADVLAKLHAIIDRGGEFDQADLILVKL